MINRQYKILKYIYKHPNTTKSFLLKKFPDFDKYSFQQYVAIEDKVAILEKEAAYDLAMQADAKRLSVGETSEFIKANMPLFKNDDSQIFYSTTINFQEYYEGRRRDFWSFWLPYGITTIIAAASLIAQFMD